MVVSAPTLEGCGFDPQLGHAKDQLNWTHSVSLFGPQYSWLDFG